MFHKTEMFGPRRKKSSGPWPKLPNKVHFHRTEYPKISKFSLPCKFEILDRKVNIFSSLAGICGQFYSPLNVRTLN